MLNRVQTKHSTNGEKLAANGDQVREYINLADPGGSEHKECGRRQNDAKQTQQDAGEPERSAAG